jgi:protein-disulfide isomerase
MASGRASRRKRAAQQAQAAAVRRHTPAADRRRWVLGAVVAALAVAAAIGVASTRAGSEQSMQEGATLPDAAAAQAIFHGVPQSGAGLGRAEAPVTLVEFVDLQCPYCREFEVEALPALVEKHVRSGKLRIEIRGLSFLGPDSERGLRAVLAAGRQDRMFELMELIYYNQGAENSGWLSDELIGAAARSVPGIDVRRLTDDMDSDAVSDLLDDHAAEAERRRVDSTPTLFVGPTGGDLARVQLASPTDLDSVERAISAAAG